VSLKRTIMIVVGLWLVAGAAGLADRLPLPAAARSPRQGPSDELRVFLFAGQSNMAGADALIGGTGDKDLAAAGEQIEADRRTLFTYCSGFSDTGEYYYPWGDVRGHRGTTYGKGGSYVHGPEVGFERTLWAAGIRNIAIIKVANNFAKYEDGRSPWVKPHSFYTAWQAVVNRRLGELRAKGYRPVVAGFGWFQGIDDGVHRRDQASYEADLRQIIADLRAEYGSNRTPFVLARSIDSVIAGHDNMLPIRSGQVAVAEADPMADWVDTDDLGPYVRKHHMTAASQLKVGERLGRAYLNLIDPKRRGGAKLH
jgi:hypothetical protein